MTTLYELSVKLRQLPGAMPEAAKRAAPRIHAEIAKNVAAERDTNHRPWEPRSPKTRLTGPMLTGAERAVQIVVRGSAILLALPFEPYGRHQVGALNQSGRKASSGGKRSHKKDPNKRLIRREIIPGANFLPPAFAAIIREEIDAVIREQMGAAA